MLATEAFRDVAGEPGIDERGVEEVETGSAQSEREWARMEARCRPSLDNKEISVKRMTQVFSSEYKAYRRSLPPLGPDPNTPDCLSEASGPTASLMRFEVV